MIAPIIALGAFAILGSVSALNWTFVEPNNNTVWYHNRVGFISWTIQAEADNGFVNAEYMEIELRDSKDHWFRRSLAQNYSIALGNSTYAHVQDDLWEHANYVIVVSSASAF